MSTSLEERILARCWRFQRYHAPALARAELAEERERAASEVRRLTYASREAYGHEARERAAVELERARRRRLALLSGEPEPPSRALQDEELRRRIVVAQF